jgi:hypothetical protein
MTDKLTQEENDELDAAAERADAQHTEVRDAATNQKVDTVEGQEKENDQQTPAGPGTAVASLEAHDEGRVVAIIPRSVEECYRLAQAMQRAGMVPKGMESRTGNAQEEASKMMISIMKGLEVGFPPITALSTIMVVNNRPSIWGDGAAALIHRSGKCEYVKDWETGEGFDANGSPNDEWTAWCEVKRKDQDEPVTRKFSIADGKRAKLVNNPKKGIWMGYPQRMLPARARAWAFRDGFADVLMGFSIYEEQRDIEENGKVEVSGNLLADETEVSLDESPGGTA